MKYWTVGVWERLCVFEIKDAINKRNDCTSLDISIISVPWKINYSPAHIWDHFLVFVFQDRFIATQNATDYSSEQPQRLDDL